MKTLLGLLILLLSVATAQAHPGVGIVQDSRGNAFFTDTKQVWKITPADTQLVRAPLLSLQAAHDGWNEP